MPHYFFFWADDIVEHLAEHGVNVKNGKNQNEGAD